MGTIRAKQILTNKNIIKMHACDMSCLKQTKKKREKNLAKKLKMGPVCTRAPQKNKQTLASYVTRAPQVCMQLCIKKLREEERGYSLHHTHR